MLTTGREATSETAPQLDGVVAARSSICLLSADDNRLAYRGYDASTLAAESTYEETAFLLLAGHLPDRAELTAFTRAVKAAQRLPRPVARLVAGAPATADPMAVLRTAVSALGLEPAGGASDITGVPAAAIALVAQLPTLVAALGRGRRGERSVAPRRGLSLAANFLYMLHGTEPHPELAGSFDAALILRADNELNPSTFAARVAAATKADLHGCMTAALAALAGPLHGGHALAVYRLLEEIGTPDRADAVVTARVQALAGKKFPGFGHPVYRGEDPRTGAMRVAAERACAATGQQRWFELAQAADERARAATGRAPNVDFYLAPLYRAAGVPPELFTPVFAIARISGWLAHVLEQYAEEGLLRPRAAYVGPVRAEYRSLRRRR